MKGEQNRQTDIPHSSSDCSPFLLVMFSFSKSRIAKLFYGKTVLGALDYKGTEEKRRKKKKSEKKD